MKPPVATRTASACSASPSTSTPVTAPSSVSSAETRASQRISTPRSSAAATRRRTTSAPPPRGACQRGTVLPSCRYTSRPHDAEALQPGEDLVTAGADVALGPVGVGLLAAPGQPLLQRALDGVLDAERALQRGVRDERPPAADRARRPQAPRRPRATSTRAPASAASTAALRPAASPADHDAAETGHRLEARRGLPPQTSWATDSTSSSLRHWSSSLMRLPLMPRRSRTAG